MSTWNGQGSCLNTPAMALFALARNLCPLTPADSPDEARNSSLVELVCAPYLVLRCMRKRPEFSDRFRIIVKPCFLGQTARTIDLQGGRLCHALVLVMEIHQRLATAAVVSSSKENLPFQRGGDDFCAVTDWIDMMCDASDKILTLFDPPTLSSSRQTGRAERRGTTTERLATVY